VTPALGAVVVTASELASYCSHVVTSPVDRTSETAEQEAGGRASSAAALRDLSGEVLIDRFKLVRLVGRGGMGAVYEARDLLLQCTVAVKTLENVLAPSSTALEVLRRELLIARRVSHANVARVFDCYEGAAGPFMTLEFLEGETLAERQRREPPLPLAEVLAVLRQVCSGVAAIHAQGIIHRDLKPSNIFLIQGHDGLRVVVTDFGIAHIDPSLPKELPWTQTRTGVIQGTPRYMAPEQLRGEQVTPSADVYALGVLAGELLGAAPNLPRNKRASTALRRALGQAATESSAARPSSPGALLLLLERAVQQRSWARSGWFALALLLLLGTATALGLWRAGRVNPPSAATASLASAKGRHLYNQGIEHLQKLDFVGARDLLEGAVTAEPGSPLARHALARAWWNLGYSTKARVLAREAWESTDSAQLEEKSRAEAFYRKAMGDLPKAEELFRRLFGTTTKLEDALDLASVQPAREAYESLLAIRKSAKDPVDPRLDLALADAATSAGRFAEASEAARLVETRARAEHSPLVLAAALRARARVTFEMDRPLEPAFGALDEAAGILRNAGDLGAVADIECDKAQLLADFGTERQFAESRLHLAKAISLFRRQGNVERAHWWLASIATRIMGHGGVAEADKLFQEAKEEIEAVGEQPDASFWAGSGWAAMYAGDLGRAKRDLARFRALTDASQVMPRPFGIVFEGELLREEDHLSEAKALLELWLERGKANRTRAISTDVPVRLARLDSDLGDPDRCLERLRQLERGGHDLGPLFARFQSPIEGTCLLQKGDASGARRLGERGWTAATTSGLFTWRILNGLVLVRADTAEHLFPEATKRAESLLAEARAHGHVPAMLESQLALGEVQVAAKLQVGTATLTALEAEAREKGFARIARLAREARRPSHR
jgi:tetratricopeptide (TPR) repeat protein